MTNSQALPSPTAPVQSMDELKAFVPPHRWDVFDQADMTTTIWKACMQATKGPRIADWPYLGSLADIRARWTWVVEQLLNLGADPNADFSAEIVLHGVQPAVLNAPPPTTLLLLAIDYGNLELASLLLDKGAHPHGKQTTPAIEALDPRVKNYAANEPLVRCVILIYGQQSEDDISQMICKLIKHGADVNRPEKDGETALHSAIRVQSPKLVQLMLDHHANFLQEIDGVSVLSLAKSRHADTKTIASKECLSLIKQYVSAHKTKTALQQAVLGSSKTTSKKSKL